MTRRLGMLAAAAVLLLALTGAACGGAETPAGDVATDGGNETPAGGGGTDGDDGTDGGDALAVAYFQQLDEAEDTYRVVADATGAALSALDETTLDEAPDIFRDIRDGIDEFVAALEELDPPAGVATAHEETIAGFRAVSELIDESLADMEAATTLNEVFAPLTSEEFASISRSLNATCNALQDAADAGGIAIDLECG